MKYFKQLDALRCYSVFWVVFIHLPLITLYPPVKQFFNFIPGVQLFFCISGFLITGIVLKNSDVSRPQFLRSFYARRFLRIFPIYYLVIFFLFLFNIENYRTTWFQYDVFYISNIVMGLQGSFDFNKISPHFWSLAVEEQFYLLWPGLLLLMTGKRGVMITGCLLFLFGAFFSIFYGSFFVLRTVGSLSYLGSGCLLAIVFHFNKDELFKLKKVIEGLLLMMILFLFFLCFLQIQLPDTFSVAITILIIPLIVLKFIFGFRNKYLILILENPFILYLGKISYGIYVYHLFALFPLLVIQKVTGSHLFDNPQLSILAKIILTIIISSLSWEFFEKKISLLKDKFNYRSKIQNI